MKRIGLFNAKKTTADDDEDDGLDPLTYANGGHIKRGVKRAHLDDDEEED
jgi:hypothetical protein